MATLAPAIVNVRSRVHGRAGDSSPSAGNCVLSGHPEVACATVNLVVVVCATEGFRVADGRVTEHGVLTAPARTWNIAMRQAEVVGPLAEKHAVGLADADAAAARLKISWRQV